MYKGKKVIVVMPAYNAAKTLCKTYEEVMAQNVVDLVMVVDDASRSTSLLYVCSRQAFISAIEIGRAHV